MPTYALRGFRWPRAGVPGIRVHIILQNIDDAAAEYIQNPRTSELFLNNLKETMPDIMEHLPNLRFIEQYDPEDLSDAAVSQPHAYVADKVITIGSQSEGGTLSCSLDELTSRGTDESDPALDALSRLRDQLAPGAQIGWFVVYNGDPERGFPGMDDASEDYDREHEDYEGQDDGLATSESAQGFEGGEEKPQKPPRPGRFRKLFGKGDSKKQ